MHWGSLCFYAFTYAGLLALGQPSGTIIGLPTVWRPRLLFYFETSIFLKGTRLKNARSYIAAV